MFVLLTVGLDVQTHSGEYTLFTLAPRNRKHFFLEGTKGEI